MSEPVPFAAFAGPDESGWGLALGTARLLEPELGPEPAGELEQLMTHAEGLTAGVVGDLPALSGTVPELPAGSSLRIVVALFGHGRVFGLRALRPRRARGHDRDEIEALVQEDGAARPVEDPRLSVTLDATGSPRRVGLELWLATAEDEVHEAPRRAAGEVEATAAALELGELTAVAQRVRWRSRGEDGRGWFVLVRGR